MGILKYGKRLDVRSGNSVEGDPNKARRDTSVNRERIVTESQQGFVARRPRPSDSKPSEERHANGTHSN